MLTDVLIQELIAEPKRIIGKTPAVGYREENRHKRCDLDLESESVSSRRFAMFVRQNLDFIENFSIGIRYLTGDPSMGSVVLARYNGPHGEYSRSPDGHYALAHIHLITEHELLLGSIQPRENLREITDRYGTLAEGLRVFVNDAGISNSEDYFPELLQGRLFDGD